MSSDFFSWDSSETTLARSSVLAPLNKKFEFSLIVEFNKATLFFQSFVLIYVLMQHTINKKDNRITTVRAGLAPAPLLIEGDIIIASPKIIKNTGVYKYLSADKQ